MNARPDAPRIVDGKRFMHTAEMDAFLIECRDKFMSIHQIAPLFNKKFGQNCTEKALAARCFRQGIKSKRLYTEEENRWLDSIVRERGSYDGLSALFKERFGREVTDYALHFHCIDLGILLRTPYNDEEKEWIKGHFYLDSAKMAKAFNKTFGTDRSVHSIRTIRQRIGALMENRGGDVSANRRA